MDTLNAKQAADILGCNERTVRNQIKAGKIPALKADGKADNSEWVIYPKDLGIGARRHGVAPRRRSEGLGNGVVPFALMEYEALLKRVAALEERVAYLELDGRRQWRSPSSDFALSANLVQLPGKREQIPEGYVLLKDFARDHGISEWIINGHQHDIGVRLEMLNGRYYLSPEQQRMAIEYLNSKPIGRFGWKGYTKCSMCSHGAILRDRNANATRPIEKPPLDA